MNIPTEPIGSIPRPGELLSAMRAHAEGEISEAELRAAEDTALRDTINRFERTGSPIISDGEQTKPSFATYPLAGFKSLAPDGVVIPFADGHIRQLPRLTAGPFHFGTYAVAYLKAVQQYTRLPVKQALISVSALSLLYPEGGISGYSREAISVCCPLFFVYRWAGSVSSWRVKLIVVAFWQQSRSFSRQTRFYLLE